MVRFLIICPVFMCVLPHIGLNLVLANDEAVIRSKSFRLSTQGLGVAMMCCATRSQSTTAEGSSSQKSRDPLSRMVHGLTQHKQKKARGDPIMSSEYEQYIKTDFVRGLQPKDYESYDVLGFWKTKENQFPVLSRMA
ncbi:zinc finger BED domain-containing protein RICESLEEPER 2-like protein [Tanacetum coccineum]